MNKPEIKKALTQLDANQEKYLRSENYYRGEHDLVFATDKFKNAFGQLFREFALNLCPAVCDALRDKLIIENFNVESGEKTLAATAWQIWQNNRMGKRSGEIHKEAIKTGDAYVIVWTDPHGQVTIYPQKANQVTVFYDAEVPGKIVLAAKRWMTADKKTRLNLYYSDRTERYITKTASESGQPTENDFIEFGEDGAAIIFNDYGIVPVFHFANNSDIGAFGESELANAIPIQDALNKTVLDMLVAMEFAAFRQRWATGIDTEYDDNGLPIAPFTAGVERLWTSENPDVRFGDFEAANLEQFLKVKADFRIDMACITGTPLYYFMLTSGEVPSGEALKKSETRFINKVRDRQESFGQIWEDVMSFALRLEGKKDTRLFADWQEAAPLSEQEKLNNIVVKKEIGISDEQALIEAGYGEQDIQRMSAEKQAKADAAINTFNAGGDLTN